ncbi:MAG: hypothetical protein ABIS51_22615 [Sphingomonas sp.]
MSAAFLSNLSDQMKTGRGKLKLFCRNWRRPYLATKDEFASERRQAAEFSPIVNGDGYMGTEMPMLPTSTRAPERAVARCDCGGPEHESDDPSHARHDPMA